MTDAPDSALGVALTVGAALDAVGAEYFVGGSVASSLQGEPRSTNDIDVVVAMPASNVEAFRDALGADFEVDTDMLRTALLQATSANAFYLPSVTKIDFFGRGREPYDEAEFSRRRSVVVGTAGETLWVKSPEDTVLRKLLWYREGGEVSDRQWRDIVGVLRISGRTMDDAYLSTWAGRLDLTALLLRARQ